MASTKASAGSGAATDAEIDSSTSRIYESILRLNDWLEKNDYRGYDTFDGLNARFLRPFTFESELLRTVLQQGVRRFPVNLRPLVGIAKSHSSKGMGYLARGFLRLYQCTGDETWKNKAEFALGWLLKHRSSGYHGSCWGNHFDYQSRSFYLPKGMPTVVWTSLIGHAFLDAYDEFQKKQYLETAVGACEHILHALDLCPDGDGTCISYIPGMKCLVHNANTLGGSLLARTYLHTRNDEYLNLARKSMHYTMKYQRADGSWWYGEKENLHWVDNFHTAYVLDCLKCYRESTGDDSFAEGTMRGYRYWKSTFFLRDGTPKYYNYKVLPIDIQCCSQAIDTLVFFSRWDDDAIPLAMKVAQWTIEYMQDRNGHFYYRRYSPWLVNRTPTLHWGQATMLSALGGLYRELTNEARLA